jgi:hypothetical protein
VRGLIVVGAAALVIVPPLFWMQPDWVRSAAASMADLGREVTITVDGRARLLGALAGLPAVLLGLYALWHLWRLFGEYAGSRFFGSQAQSHLRRFAWATLLAALFAPLQRALTSVALTLGNPPGQRMLVFGFSSTDYYAILLGAVLLAVATVQSEAARLAEENEGFV